MRPTHPFFRGPLAPGDLVPCPSHEHQSKHFDRERWPSVSWHCHRLLPPSSCCLSPFLEEHDMEQSIPSVRSHTHKQKHPETNRVCSPLRRSSRRQRMPWGRKPKSHHLTPDESKWDLSSRFRFPLKILISLEVVGGGPEQSPQEPHNHHMVRHLTISLVKNTDSKNYFTAHKELILPLLWS